MNEVERDSMKPRDARLPASGASGLVLAGVLTCVLACAVPASAVQISGRVTSQATGAGVDGVAVYFSDGGGEVQTANGGWYTNEVEESWSGAARPDYGVRKFAPASRAYTNTTANQTNQDFAVLNELAWDYVREVEVAHSGSETLTNHQVSLTLDVAVLVFLIDRNLLHRNQTRGVGKNISNNGKYIVSLSKTNDLSFNH